MAEAEELTPRQTACAIAHPAAGTYRDETQHRYVQIAVVDGKPREIGWIRADVPVEMRQWHERRVWDRFIGVK